MTQVKTVAQDRRRAADAVAATTVCCCARTAKGETLNQARFYCCGRVPAEGYHRKRHGMCETRDLDSSSSVELALDAFEFVNLGITKIPCPAVPYCEDLPEELYQGRAIEIHGRLHDNAKRFSINLSTGKESTANVAMHFNPRFDRRVVIRNHRIKNKWGVEEILSLQPFPFTPGRNFSVLIFVADEQFFVAVNRVHYCAFSFRIPIEKVKSLLILGDITLKLLQHYDRTSYPPENLKKNPKIIIPHPLKNENIKCDIRRKLKAIKIGSKIDIIGRLKLLPHAFYVNLQKGIALWPHPIIPFHMNLRLYPPGTHKREKEIIFNSWLNGFWGEEEIISFCPFLPGTTFHIRIICKVNGFSVLVNNKNLFHYKKTIIDSEVDSVVIHGDIVVSKVVIH